MSLIFPYRKLVETQRNDWLPEFLEIKRLLVPSHDRYQTYVQTYSANKYVFKTASAKIIYI